MPEHVEIKKRIKKNNAIREVKHGRIGFIYSVSLLIQTSMRRTKSVCRFSWNRIIMKDEKEQGTVSNFSGSGKFELSFNIFRFSKRLTDE